MTMVIINWLILKKCLLNNLEGKDFNKYGSMITFLNRYLNIDTSKYNYLLSLVLTLLYCYSAYYFAGYNSYHQYFILLLTISMIISLYK